MLLVALFFSNVVFHMSIVKSYGKMKIHISLGSFVSEGSPCAQERNLLEIDHNFFIVKLFFKLTCCIVHSDLPLFCCYNILCLFFFSCAV